MKKQYIALALLATSIAAKDTTLRTLGKEMQELREALASAKQAADAAEANAKESRRLLEEARKMDNATDQLTKRTRKYADDAGISAEEARQAALRSNSQAAGIVPFALTLTTLVGWKNIGSNFGQMLTGTQKLLVLAGVGATIFGGYKLVQYFQETGADE